MHEGEFIHFGIVISEHQTYLQLSEETLQLEGDTPLFLVWPAIETPAAASQMSHTRNNKGCN